jgi:hypothetical protein
VLSAGQSAGRRLARRRGFGLEAAHVALQLEHCAGRALELAASGLVARGARLCRLHL